MATQNHIIQCNLCKHKDKEEIEARYHEWRSPESLAQDYPDLNHDGIRRHMKAFKLDEKRNSNLMGACTAIMERGFTCMKNSPVDAKSVVSAANLRAKLAGLITEKREHSGKVTNEIDISKQVNKQIGNILDVIGMPNDKDIPDLEDSYEIEED